MGAKASTEMSSQDSTVQPPSENENNIVFETPFGIRIHLVMGDLTKLEVDCIVNAANSIMLGGGGVDGAIHRAAGPTLLAACRAVPVIEGTKFRCNTGMAVLTKGPFDKRLAATDVIHTVGPIVQVDSNISESQRLLSKCISNSLQIALEQDYRAIAFPAISCGIFNGIGQEWTDMAAVVNIRTCLEVASNTKQQGSVMSLRDVMFAFNERPLYLAWRAAAANLIPSVQKSDTKGDEK